jgi:hypothetical protein
MSVINVILITIASMLGIAMMSMPLIFAFKGYGAWQSLSRDIYAPYKQRIFGIRPGVYWCSIAVVNLVADWFKPLLGKSCVDFVSVVSLVVSAFLLATHLRWSGKLLGKGQALDGRLLRFAKYTFGWCAALLILILSFSLLNLLLIARQ